MIISTVRETRNATRSNLSSTYCFYHTVKEQYLGINKSAYFLCDLGESTVVASGMIGNIPKILENMIGKIYAPISDFIVVPVNPDEWVEHDILTPDFTQAIVASRW